VTWPDLNANALKAGFLRPLNNENCVSGQKNELSRGTLDRLNVRADGDDIRACESDQLKV
jgi:hypothetical protein